MIWVWRATVEWHCQGKTEQLGRKICPSATLSTTNPTWIDRAWTRASAVTGRRLTTWATARPTMHGYVWKIQILHFNNFVRILLLMDKWFVLCMYRKGSRSNTKLNCWITSSSTSPFTLQNSHLIGCYATRQLSFLCWSSSSCVTHAGWSVWWQTQTQTQTQTQRSFKIEYASVNTKSCRPR
jgi:hypothetical protein